MSSPALRGRTVTETASAQRSSGGLEGIASAPDKVVGGTFRGQGNVNFLIKGSDVVVTTPAGDFVTILRDGINNRSVRRALEAAR